jgi:hypothetical protein
MLGCFQNSVSVKSQCMSFDLVKIHPIGMSNEEAEIFRNKFEKTSK